MTQISAPTPGHKPQEPVSKGSNGSLKPVDKRVANRVLARLGLMTKGAVEPRVRQIIGEGKDKLIVEHEQATKVYMLPQASFLSLCRRNIEKEVGFINAVKAALKEHGEIANLAVDITPAQGKRGAWEMDKAAGNLEKKIVGEHDWAKGKSYCLDFVRGMMNLHKANFVHGDIKLENLLLFLNKSDPAQSHVKVSDFGKGAKVSGDKPSGLYSGNTRFGPPEGALSKAGDVYGVGICLIRILEEQLLTGEKNTLMPVHETTRKIPPAHSDRRGVEKYILDNPAFTRSYETKGSFSGKVLDFCARVRTCAGKVSKEQLAYESEALNRYIDVLCKELEKQGKLGPLQASSLKAMLQFMTDPNPGKRISMEMAEKALEFILDNNKK